MINFIFIPKDKSKIQHNRKNRKNKGRLFYSWRLERVVKTLEKATSHSECFPSTSEQGRIQLVKNEIIEKCNQNNIFGFDYFPLEKDFLSIMNSKQSYADYLNLIYLNGVWVEEVYIGSLRDMDFDTYEMLEEGGIEL